MPYLETPKELEDKSRSGSLADIPTPKTLEARVIEEESKRQEVEELVADLVVDDVKNEEQAQENIEVVEQALEGENATAVVDDKGKEELRGDGEKVDVEVQEAILDVEVDKEKAIID